MSHASHTPPVRLSLPQLRKQAKELLKAHRDRDPAVAGAFRRLPKFADAPTPDILSADVALSDAQYALALEHGFSSWPRLKRYVEGREPRPRCEVRREGGAAWITGVGRLGWGTERDCTFLGALAAALDATDDPWTYADLAGLSGLAFRVRWSPEFCPSCAVGELPDEFAALRRATGWALDADVQFGRAERDEEAIRRRVVASVDAGLPVLAYGVAMDMAVVYGYEDGGRTLWLADYHADRTPHKLPLARLGPMQVYLRREADAPGPREQLRHGLSLAAAHWKRREHDGGIAGRRYLYGPAAYDAWLAALNRADSLPPDRLAALHHTHCFACRTLADARRAGARFLGERFNDAPARAHERLRAAMGHSAAQARRVLTACDAEGLLGGPGDAWTPKQRLREREIVNGLMHQDRMLLKECARALAAMEE